MKYTIEFRCGHSGDVHIYGKKDKRDYIAEQKEYDLCEECKKAEFEKQRKKENEEAANKAKEMELPTLAGTEKQIAWAETIRQKLIKRIEESIVFSCKEQGRYYFREDENFAWKQNGFKKEDNVELLNFMIKNKVEARWYIDNREDAGLKELYKDMQNNTPEKKAEKQLLKDIESDLTIFPENSIDKEPVKIIIKDDYIRLYFHKDDNFISFVKSEGYKWDYVWERHIDKFAGNIIDRAKEIGNKLLNAGYGIIAPTQEILDGAIKGEYEKEVTRWVLNRKDTDLLAIWWRDKDDNLYSKARKISSSKWSSPSVTVKKEHYAEVLDFAEMNNFYVAESAYKLIEKYKNSIKFVKPEKVKEEIFDDDKIEKILESDRNVLEDLKDED